MSLSSEILERLEGFPSIPSEQVALTLLLSSSTDRFESEAFHRFCAVVLDDKELAAQVIQDLIESGTFIVTSGEIMSLGPGHGHLVGMRDRVMETGSAHWNGEFSVFVADERIQGDAYIEVHRTMRRARFATLQQGCWMRPSNLAIPFEDDEGELPEGLHVMRARLPHPRSLVGRLWDLDSWNAQAALLSDLQNDAVRALETEGPSAIRAANLTLCVVGLLLAADPRLPPALAPSGWLSTTVLSGFYKLDLISQKTLQEHLNIVPA